MFKRENVLDANLLFGENFEKPQIVVYICICKLCICICVIRKSYYIEIFNIFYNDKHSKHSI